VRFATDLLPNVVVRIKDTTSLAKFLEQTPEIPHVLLFSSKTEVSPLIKSLALSYKGRISFGQVNQDTKEVVAKYSVDTFPKLLVIKGDEEPVAYEGAINPEELRKFVAGYADETEVQEEMPAPPPPRVRPAKIVTSVSYEEVTVDNIDKVCQGLCILGFVDVESADDKRTVKTEHQQLLDEVLYRFKLDGKFKFGWVDKTSQISLSQKFSLTDQPALLVFNGKRQRFVKADTFDFKSCGKMIEHVLTGDAQFISL